MKVVSKKIRQSARGEECSFRFPGICNFNPETTVWCHINTKFKGMGTKSNDLHGAYGCSDCHDALDGRTIGEVKVKDKYVLDAIVESQMKLIDKGLLVVK